MKKLIYIDMDGVIANFDKAAQEQGNGKRPDLYVNYRNLELIPGSKDALIKLNKDFDILKKWTIGNHTPSIAKGYPEDMHMFVELRNEKQRALVTPLPGFSTHGETNFLTPYRDWSKV